MPEWLACGTASPAAAEEVASSSVLEDCGRGQTEKWLKCDLPGADLDNFYKYVSALSTTLAAPTSDIRLLLASDAESAGTPLRCVSEKLLAGGRLCMAVTLESVVAVALDSSALCLSLFLGFIVSGVDRRRANNLDETVLKAAFENATLPEILSGIDKFRPRVPRYPLAG